MPPFFEEAAQMLCHMVRMGLVIEPSLDARVVIFKIAAHISSFRDKLPTHAQAAIKLLDDLNSTGRISLPSKSRAKMIAVVGTILGNLSCPAVRGPKRTSADRSSF